MFVNHYWLEIKTPLFELTLLLYLKLCSSYHFLRAYCATYLNLPIGTNAAGIISVLCMRHFCTIVTCCTTDTLRYEKWTFWIFQHFFFSISYPLTTSIMIVSSKSRFVILVANSAFYKKKSYCRIAVVGTPKIRLWQIHNRAFLLYEPFFYTSLFFVTTSLSPFQGLFYWRLFIIPRRLRPALATRSAHMEQHMESKNVYT